MSAIIPQPRFPIVIRPGTMEDLPFIDGLQKKQTKQVGWFPTKTIEGKIKAGQVLVAEEGSGFRVEGSGNAGEVHRASDAPLSPLNPEPRTLNPVGYCIAQDQYFKRDDVGIIYQLNVVEGKRRGLVGAMLLKAQFERSAYGCKLYCCWCAQDIEANHFWEACGFVPLAFRAGSAKKRRVHIFWCKRIREGDVSTPWWFPAETKGGSIMEDRLVLPIPPGTHWRDAKPIVLPRDTHAQVRRIEGGGGARSGKTKKMNAAVAAATAAEAAVRKPGPLSGGLTFAVAAEPATEKPQRQRKQKVRNDPKFVSAARELRDRWLEKVNQGGQSLPAGAGKYAVTREIEGRIEGQMGTGEAVRGVRLLEAA